MCYSWEIWKNLTSFIFGYIQMQVFQEQIEKLKEKVNMLLSRRNISNWIIANFVFLEKHVKIFYMSKRLERQILTFELMFYLKEQCDYAW